MNHSFLGRNYLSTALRTVRNRTKGYWRQASDLKNVVPTNFRSVLGWMDSRHHYGLRWTTRKRIDETTVLTSSDRENAEWYFGSLIFLLSFPSNLFCFDLQLQILCHQCGLKVRTRLHITEGFFKGCGGSLFVSWYVGCRIVVVVWLLYRFVSSSSPCSMVLVVVIISFLFLLLAFVLREAWALRMQWQNKKSTGIHKGDGQSSGKP